jgi:hypothetical protein
MSDARQRAWLSQPQPGWGKTIAVCCAFHTFYIGLPTTLVAGPLLVGYYFGARVAVGALLAYVVSTAFLGGTFRPENGTGAPSRWCVNLPHWWWLFQYFPARIVGDGQLAMAAALSEEADGPLPPPPPFAVDLGVDPADLHIFVLHPHGTLAFHRALFGFATKQLWEKAFPALSFRVLTATAALLVPFIREWWLWSYCVDASRPVAQGVLDAGISLVLYAGGEHEQMLTQRGRHRVYLPARRNGFVRLALQNGASLVPVYTFGETDLYTHHGCCLGARVALMKKLAVAAPLISGVCGILPYRVPLTAVVGAPIEVQRVAPGIDLRNSAEGKALVGDLHAQYVAALSALFDANKAACGYADATLEIVRDDEE